LTVGCAGLPEESLGAHACRWVGCPIVPLSPFGPFGYLYGEMMTTQTMSVTEFNNAGLVTQSMAGNDLREYKPSSYRLVRGHGLFGGHSFDGPFILARRIVFAADVEFQKKLTVDELWEIFRGSSKDRRILPRATSIVSSKCASLSILQAERPWPSLMPCTAVSLGENRPIKTPEKGSPTQPPS